MNFTLWNVARQLALSPDPRQRWRQVSVVGTAFLATLLGLVGAGLVHAASEGQEHVERRSPVIAASQGSSLLEVAVRGPILPETSQFPMVWLSPAPGHEDDPRIIPPGLTTLPEPGSAVLSPGLVAAGYRASDFGLTESRVGLGEGGTIGDEGLRTRSEGYLYARPATGRDLSSDDPFGRLFTTGFTPGAGPRAHLETIPDAPARGDAWVLVTWSLWLPCLYLLIGGARATSSIRDHRARMLWDLGVAVRRIRQVVALETAVLALIGSLPATALWLAIDRRIVDPPWLRAKLLPGSTVLHPLLVATALVVVVGVAAAASSAGRITRRSVTNDARRVRTYQAIPLLAAVLLMIAAPWTGDSSHWTTVLYTGMILTLVTLPLGLPVIVSRIAMLLGRARHPAAWLAGRRLSLHTRNLTRPAAMVGALVFMAGSALALIYGAQASAFDPPPSDRSVWMLTWRDARPADQVSTGLIEESWSAPVIDATDWEPGDGTSPPASQTVVVQSCAEASALLSDRPDCINPSAIPGAVRTALGRWGYGIEIVPESPAADRTSGILLITPTTALVDEVYATMAGLPGANATQVAGPSPWFHQGVEWIYLGWLMASGTLFVAMLREVADRSVLLLGDQHQLLRTGLTTRESDAVFAWSVLTPVAAAVPLGGLCAVIFALRGNSLGITVLNVGLIAVVAAAGTLVAVLAILAVMTHHRRSGPA